MSEKKIVACFGRPPGFISPRIAFTAISLLVNLPNICKAEHIFWKLLVKTPISSCPFGFSCISKVPPSMLRATIVSAFSGIEIVLEKNHIKIIEILNTAMVR
jgi:hypothetical protein